MICYYIMASTPDNFAALYRVLYMLYFNQFDDLDTVEIKQTKSSQTKNVVPRLSVVHIEDVKMSIHMKEEKGDNDIVMWDTCMF